MDNCSYCSIDDSKTIYKYHNTLLVIPHRLHISPDEGGHLVAIPQRHVRSRLYLSPKELFELDLLSILGSNILIKLLGTDWFNYQDNGNWGLNKPETQHVHLHIYGRKKNAKNQIYGEALKFPLKSELNSWLTGQFTDSQIENAKNLVPELVKASWFKEFEEAFAHI